MDIRLGNKELFFKMDKSTYKIPSKMYPLSSKSGISIFLDENSKLIEDERVHKAVNLQKFKMGHCYSNTLSLIEYLSSLGVEAKPFAGWIFLGNNYPVHHAWVVLDGNVIDGSVRKNEVDFLNDLAKQNLSQEELRAKYKDYLIREMNSKVPNSERIVLGDIPKGIVYVGSEDKPEEAKNRFRKTMDMFPIHPSYTGGMNGRGASKMQEEVIKSTKGQCLI